MLKRTVTMYAVNCEDCEELAGDWHDYAEDAEMVARELGWQYYGYTKVWRCPDCAAKFEEIMTALYEEEKPEDEQWT